MSIKDQINKDLIIAMKAKNMEEAGLLRTVLANIKNEEIANKGEIKEEAEIAIIKRELKQRTEAATEFKKGKRDDLAKKEEQEAKIIEKYMPEQMAEADIEEIVKKVIKDTNATSKQQMGQVMGKVMAELQGKADGQVVSSIVNKLLQ